MFVSLEGGQLLVVGKQLRVRFVSDELLGRRLSVYECRKMGVPECVL